MPKRSLRQRNRHAAMQLLQRVALDLFETRGFDAVTVREIADACGVSESTVYRYFGTKEGLIVWDEYDQKTGEELMKRLGREPPVAAFQNAFAAALESQPDSSYLLRRVRLMHNTPQLAAAALAQNDSDAAGLAEAFAARTGRCTPSIADDALAACCLAATYVAVDYWQRSDGAEDLTELIHEAFEILGD